MANAGRLAGEVFGGRCEYAGDLKLVSRVEILLRIVVNYSLQCTKQLRYP
jgi:hypothetical protein